MCTDDTETGGFCPRENGRYCLAIGRDSNSEFTHRLLTCVHTHAHVHTHTHTHRRETLTHTHPRRHAHTNTRTRIYTQAHTHTHNTCTYIHTYVRTYKHACLHTHAPISKHTHLSPPSHTRNIRAQTHNGIRLLETAPKRFEKLFLTQRCIPVQPGHSRSSNLGSRNVLNYPFYPTYWGHETIIH